MDQLTLPASASAAKRSACCRWSLAFAWECCCKGSQAEALRCASDCRQRVCNSTSGPLIPACLRCTRASWRCLLSISSSFLAFRHCSICFDDTNEAFPEGVLSLSLFLSPALLGAWALCGVGHPLSRSLSRLQQIASDFRHARLQLLAILDSAMARGAAGPRGSRRC